MELTPGGQKGSLFDRFDEIVKGVAGPLAPPPAPGPDTNLLAAARAALTGTTLSEPARALLLLRLRERGSALPPAEAEALWAELEKTAKKALGKIPGATLPGGALKEFEELRSALFPAHAPEDEEDEAEPPKGFEAELEAEIRAALALAPADRDAAVAKLRTCDERVEGRSRLLGKHRAERQLVWAWASVDRDVALARIERLKKAGRWELVKLLSITEPLTPQAWNEVVRSVGMKDARTVVVQLLGNAAEDPLGGALLAAQGLYLPPELLEAVAEAIKEMAGPASTTAANVQVVQTALGTFASLVRLVREGGPTISTLYGSLLTSFGTRMKGTVQLPALQLAATEALVRIGVDTKLLGDENVDALFRGLGDERRNLAWARYAAETASPDTVLRAVELVSSRTGNDRAAVALCLQRLVERGLGREVVGAADRAGLDDLLRGAVRRTWLEHDPAAARTVLTPDVFRGDPVGELLTQPDVPAMVAHLRAVTANGSGTLPGPMWVVPGEERPSGFKGRRWDAKRAAMSVEQVVAEYIERTPLYSIRTTTGRPDVELEEWVDLMGFGRYRCGRLDPVLLGALVAWGDGHADEVASLSETCWDEICPETQILFANDLRTEILTRCSTVLAADPDVFLDSCVAWLDREWVKRGRKHGRTEAHLPAATLGAMCLMAAEAVRPASPARSDHLLTRALGDHVSEFDQVRSAAAIFARGKPPLAFEPPVKLRSVQRGAWELGVIDAALPKQIPTPAVAGGGSGAGNL